MKKIRGEGIFQEVSNFNFDFWNVGGVIQRSSTIIYITFCLWIDQSCLLQPLKRFSLYIWFFITDNICSKVIKALFPNESTMYDVRLPNFSALYNKLVECSLRGTYSSNCGISSSSSSSSKIIRSSSNSTISTSTGSNARGTSRSSKRDNKMLITNLVLALVVEKGG